MSKAAIAEFMAHLVIADEHIHSDQVAMLRDFIHTHGLSEYQKIIFAVLEGRGGKHLPELLEKLRELDSENEELLIQNAAAIVGFNRHFSKEEKASIERLCKATGINQAKLVEAVRNIICEATNAREAKNTEDRPLENFGSLSLKVRRFFARGARREYLSSKIRENQLSGPEYSNAIRVTNEIAEVDCQLVESQLENCFSVLNKVRNEVLVDLKKAKPPIENATEDEETFYEFMTELSASLDLHARESIAELKDILDKKQRAKNAFTIALMGRTKAGKSTLHFVMTDEGKDFIGKGSERTTRFNRVYEWENLRIIDTPGVGAAEAGGRNDEDIALSVVDTADVICYVVTNDSVQEVEFQFLTKIRNSNKPVFILLNCKENLRSPPPKFKKFIADPLHWYSRQDEHNLEGIVKRIERGVSKYYDGGHVTIIPVHLMAAKLAKENAYRKDWDSLTAGSRMNEFFNEIRENVIELGKLRKSQTLLDNTACRLAAMHQELFTRRQHSLRMAADVETKNELLLRQLKERTKKNQASFLRELGATIEHERSHALEFASDNYKLKQKDIEGYWKKEAQRISEDVREKLIAQVERASEEVKSYLAEAVDDISIGAEINFDGGFGDYNTFNTRRLTSVLGALVSSGGGIALIVIGGISNPGGWVAVGVIAVGAIVGLISGFMTSKEEKKRKAVAHMTRQVDESLKSLKAEYTKHAESIFDEFQKTMKEAIRSSLLQVANQYRSSSERISPCVEALSKAITKLNVHFAIRIMEFAGCDTASDVSDHNCRVNVKREFGKSIEIFTYDSVPPEGLRRVEQALKERVVVNTLAEVAA